MKTKFIVVAIVFLCLGAVYLVDWNGDTGKKTDILLNPSSASIEDNLSESEAEPVAETEESCIYVYVCGNVINPGVYSLNENARMYEAIEMAGGVSAEGCIQYMELAQILYDGQRIYVPDNNEAIGALGNEDLQSGLININTADKSMLMELPGIGEAKAEAIIAYREEVGRFARIEDIMNISGIKEAAFSKIKEYICAY